MIDVTIRPDDLTAHKNIVIDLAEDAVDETNEAWRITIEFVNTPFSDESSGRSFIFVQRNSRDTNAHSR